MSKELQQYSSWVKFKKKEYSTFIKNNPFSHTKIDLKYQKQRKTIGEPGW